MLRNAKDRVPAGRERSKRLGIKIVCSICLVFICIRTALGLPLFEAEIPPQASNEIYESAFAHALTRARERESGLAHIAFGDLYLADVRAYREAPLARLSWRGVYPLWGEDTAKLVTLTCPVFPDHELVESGSRVGG